MKSPSSHSDEQEPVILLRLTAQALSVLLLFHWPKSVTWPSVETACLDYTQRWIILASIHANNLSLAN